MNTLVHPADSRGSDNRTGLRRLNPGVQSYGGTHAEVRWNVNATTARSLHLPHCLAEDANGSHLVNFPFAFTVFMILTTGLTTVGLGIIVTNAWLAGVGFLTTLVGCFLYGWSLHDE
ncbi:MAG: hypothetical protein IH623_17090 [Verrucomicrobia bacterium]|nr:hypothetical protein [Verrucomicrobiota bacterium]